MCDGTCVLVLGMLHGGLCHFRGCYVQTSMVLRPEGCVPIREVSSFQRVLCTGFNGVGT